MSENTTEATTDTTEPVEGATPETEQLGESGIAALKSEREARKAAEKERSDLAARLKEFEDRDKSDAQKQQEAIEQLQAELAKRDAAIAASELAKTRAEVAAGKGIPVDVLRGETREELEKFADTILEFAAAQKASPRVSEAIGRANGAQVSGTPADVFAEWSEQTFNNL